MQRLLATSIFIILNFFFINAQSDGDLLFNQNILHEIRFESDDANFFNSLDSVWSANILGVIPYLPCKVIIDGSEVDSVGLRVKGGLSSFNEKKPLKIDFDKFIEGQNFDGIKKLNLHNGDFDPSTIREAISYEILRQSGVKSSRTAFAQVFINDELHGVYTMTEQVNKNFLRNYFADDEGTLYKNKVCDIEIASGPSTMSHYNELIDAVSISDETQFINTLETLLATEDFLRFFFVEVFINAVDNPIDVGCNFYVYHEPLSNLIYWIPWDFNLALNGGANYPLIPDQAFGNSIFNKMLTINIYREKYLSIACDLLNFLHKNDNLFPIIDNYAALLRDALEIDPRFDYTISEFDAEIIFLKDLISTRIMDLEIDLVSENFDCTYASSPITYQEIVINEFMASNDSLSGISDPSGGYADWIELYNNTNTPIELTNCYLSDDKDFLKHWRFPTGTTINANEYLIVWIDRDVDEEGLHADFKLSKNEGAIFLLYEDFTIIDSVNYNNQITNTSAARIPNGTGDFVQQPPTFSSNNLLTSSKDQLLQNNLKVNIYPNPTSQYVKIELKNHSPKSFQLKVYTSIGQNIYTSPLIKNSVELQLDQWKKGIYFFEIKNSEGIKTEKIVIE